MMRRAWKYGEAGEGTKKEEWMGRWVGVNWERKEKHGRNIKRKDSVGMWEREGNIMKGREWTDRSDLGREGLGEVGKGRHVEGGGGKCGDVM